MKNIQKVNSIECICTVGHNQTQLLPCCNLRGGVLDRHDVVLDRVLGGVTGVARGHGAFVEGALSANTVIAADAQDYGALFFHWVVARPFGPDAVVVGGQRARGSVGTAEGPEVGPSLEHGREETVVDGRVGRVLCSVIAREQSLLEIGHEPRTFAGARHPAGRVAKIDGLHVTVARVATVGLGVAVVEATAAVVVRPIEHGVHALSSVPLGRAFRLIVAVTGAWSYDQTCARYVDPMGGGYRGYFENFSQGGGVYFLMTKCGKNRFFGLDLTKLMLIYLN